MKLVNDIKLNNKYNILFNCQIFYFISKFNNYYEMKFGYINLLLEIVF